MKTITQTNKLFAAVATVAMCATLALPFAASAATVKINPDNLQGWQETSVRGDGVSEITAEVPDQYGGNASLSQSSSDGAGKTNYFLAKDFGAVADVTSLSFEWYRDSVSTAPAHLTPALGLYVSDGAGNSWLLKWEGVYNGYPSNGTGAPTDVWTNEDLTDDNFWRIPQQVNGTFVGFGGCNQAGDPYECFQFDRQLTDAWLDGFDVVAVEVGIGSGWNGTYQSYADFVTINETTYDFELDLFERTVAITAPTAGQEVSGVVDFAAILNDKDGDDSAQWAVRADSCGGTTVAGNVDGFSTAFTFDGADFASAVDMTTLAAGEYCFVFNPTESAGDEALRATQTFTLVDVVVPDTDAPVVTINTPIDGAEVSGDVTVNATISDEEMGNYNVAVYAAGADITDFSQRIIQDNVTNADTFTNEDIWTFDSTTLADGDYVIRLAARDAAGNRDLSTPAVGGDDSIHVVSITVKNIPDEPEDVMDKNQCKQGGYADFGFKNQGQCIKFIETGKDSR